MPGPRYQRRVEFVVGERRPRHRLRQPLEARTRYWITLEMWGRRDMRKRPRFIEKSRVVCLTLLAAVALEAGAFSRATALAQAPAAKPAADAPAANAPQAAANDAPKVKVERTSGGKKVYRITEEIRIEGKIQKPEAFFFYQKSSINYDWQEMKQDFLPRILDSVERSPF